MATVGTFALEAHGVMVFYYLVGAETPAQDAHDPVNTIKE